MASLNRALILGYCGQDPELRRTQGGEAVCSLRVATTDTWTGKDGQKQERTEWHAIVCFGALGETCAKHLTKGRQVFIEGRIQSRKYTDKDGVERRVTEVVASAVHFLSESGRTGTPTRGRQEVDDESPF